MEQRRSRGRMIPPSGNIPLVSPIHMPCIALIGKPFGSYTYVRHEHAPVTALAIGFCVTCASEDSLIRKS